MMALIWLLKAVTFGILVSAKQPSAPAAVPAPLRELPWGQLNFLHTSDTHGWHAGHLQEPSYSADWGDYISFSERLRERADKEGVDVLLVDTGDRVEGNGLYDASNPKGNFTSDIFKHQDIDIITCGNHELYKSRTVERELDTVVPNFKETYIASNLEFIDPQTAKPEPFAQRFRIFTTKNQNIRILAFGFLFDFTGNANNTIVQPVEKTVQENWFQDAIREKDVDLIVVTGHVGIRAREFQAIHKAIRQVKWDTPVQFFGGHTHIRDYAKYDAKSYAIESGRYMETIGFMSINGIASRAKSAIYSVATAPNFARRYIDNNLFSFLSHTRLNESDFHTKRGRAASAEIRAARKSLDLDKQHGCAPQDFWLSRAPYPSKDSALTLLDEHILPEMVKDSDRADKQRLIFVNSGAIRFDIFKGPFTRDTTYIVSPFSNGFNFIKDVPYESAKDILSLLNNNSPFMRQIAPDLAAVPLAPPEHMALKYKLQSQESDEMFRLPEQDSFSSGSQAPLGTVNEAAEKDPDLIPGYTTADDAGKDGDDTLHAPIEYHRVPNCIQSTVGFDAVAAEPPETVDLVFIEFIQPWILLALQYLGEEYAEVDVLHYGRDKSFNQILTEWVQKNWKADC